MLVLLECFHHGHFNHFNKIHQHLSFSISLLITPFGFTYKSTEVCSNHHPLPRGDAIFLLPLYPISSRILFLFQMTSNLWGILTTLSVTLFTFINYLYPTKHWTLDRSCLFWVSWSMSNSGHLNNVRTWPTIWTSDHHPTWT